MMVSRVDFLETQLLFIQKKNLLYLSTKEGIL